MLRRDRRKACADEEVNRATEQQRKAKMSSFESDVEHKFGIEKLLPDVIDRQAIVESPLAYERYQNSP